jgi:hypothetical protein
MRAVAAAILAVALSACSSSSSDTRQEALSYARDDIACTTSDDCCAVEDGCMSDMLLVAAADRDHVAQLISESPQDMCTACITPPVQVDCRGGVCVMLLLAEADPGADWNLAADFRRDHCGVMTVPDGWEEQTVATASRHLAPATVIGCGAGL